MVVSWWTVFFCVVLIMQGINFCGGRVKRLNSSIHNITIKCNVRIDFTCLVKLSRKNVHLQVVSLQVLVF